MERGGGCCIARYAHDMSKVDRIMLRFRPIAPKPASSNGSVSTEVKSSGILAETGRGKRKRASKDRESCNSSGKKKASKGKVTKSNSGGESSEKEVITLPLLPETPESAKIAGKQPSGGRRPLWLSFGNDSVGENMDGDVMCRRVVVWSWVTVESVRETRVWEYGNLGHTDEERVRRLDGDTCPGFVSDGLNRVRWMNGEYRRMVGGGDTTGAEAEVVGWVVVGEGVVVGPEWEAFTCRVKVVTWEGVKRCKTLPCDVWRMACGGFAWRLDTQAALSLSL